MVYQDTFTGDIEPDKQHQVQTIDDKIKPVGDRIPSVQAAEHLFDQYRHAMTKVAMADAKVIALHRGVEPYEPEKLKALGQGWRANLNTREMKGSVNHRADAAYDFHMDVDTRIKVYLRPEYKDYQAPNPQINFGQIIAEEYSYALNVDWPENYLLVDQTSRDRIKLGLGVATWRDHLDWRPVHVPKMNFFTDPLFAPLAAKIPACCIRDTLPVQDLINYIDNPASAEKAGWDIDALKETVAAFWKAPGDNSQPEPPSARDGLIGHWAAFEQWRASRPADMATLELQNLPVVRILIKSVDSEKVSHYIMVDTNVVPAQPEAFLYKRVEQFDNMAQAVWLNPYNYAEGTIGSIDGLGHDLAPYCEISSRMLCTALDGGMMSGGLLLQAAQGFDADELSVLRMGPTTIIPPGLQAVQSSFSPPIDRLLELRSAVRGVVSNNVGMTRMNPELMEQAARGTRSRDEVALERNREFRIETNSANFEYMMWTILHREMFRRMVKQRKMSDKIPGAKEAKSFVQRCVNRGVPEILFDNFEDALVVEVNRTIGDGSAQSRTQIWSTMMSLRGEMDEAGRRHTQRQYVASLIGYKNVDDLFPLWNRNEIPSNEQSMATLENNDFREGSPVPVGSDQIHVLHIEVHLKPLMDMAQMYNQTPEQADVEMILRMFAAAIPHISDHIQFLSRDPTREGFVKQVSNLLKELVVFYRRVEKEAAEMMNEQQQLQQQRQQAALQQLEQQMNSETQAKLRKVELDAQLEAMKQQSIAEVRASKTQAQNEIRRWGAEAKAELDRAIAERKMALEEEIARRRQETKERNEEVS
jgi:hypothetical protein